MKINVETKFNVGDFVRQKADDQGIGTKMLLTAIGVDFQGHIACLCEWVRYDKVTRMAFDEDSLVKWNGENG